MRSFRLPRWVVVIAAAAVFLPLAVDWVAPGEGARLSCLVLRASCGTANDQLPAANCFPLWRWLVGLAGRDVAALGWISVGAGLVCVWLVATIFGTIFGAAVRKADVFGKNEFPFVESAAVLLAGLAFALTPGFLAAATRVSPLMVALVPPLAAVALAVRPGRGRLLLAVGLVGYSVFEFAQAWRKVLALAFPAAWGWLAVGVMPALVIAWCVRKRWLLGRRGLWWSFGAWGTAVAVTGVAAVFSGRLNEGRVASRIVARIIANADGRGRGSGNGERGWIAIVSDGGLDDLFFFMLPEKVKLISLARESEPEYGRELSEWVREKCNVETWKCENDGMGKVRKRESEASTANLVEDLAFAAELGPSALVDEWEKLDKQGFEAAVASVANYFPTRKKWDEACAELGGMRTDEPMAKYLRHLLGVCGNALGCRMLESASRGGRDGTGDDGEREAWAVFKTIVDFVEPTNYGAYLNLLGMVQRGFAASKDEVSDLTRRLQQVKKRLRGRKRILDALHSSGRIYADSENMAKYENAETVERGLTPEAKALIETAAAAPKDPKKGRAAQEAIRKAIREGKVRLDKIGGRLITIDLAIGDRENAERDAIDVLKLDRHEPTANAALGSFAGARGDYKRAERYLRRAIETGKASIAAKNDFVYTLMRLGRFDEAEPFAREVVGTYDGVWGLRETLAAILIRRGKVEEGERELAKAEAMAAKAGIPKGRIVSIEIDRARILKAKGDYERLKMAMRVLRSRKDLTEEQRKEVEGMDR